MLVPNNISKLITVVSLQAYMHVLSRKILHLKVMLAKLTLLDATPP